MEPIEGRPQKTTSVPQGASAKWVEGTAITVVRHVIGLVTGRDVDGLGLSTAFREGHRRWSQQMTSERACQRRRRALFAAEDADGHIPELWKSDGTPGGTKLVKDINPGANGSDIEDLTVLRGVLYFSASNATRGRELWKSNGTTAGTRLVKDIRRAPAHRPQGSSLRLGTSCSSRRIPPSSSTRCGAPKGPRGAPGQDRRRHGSFLSHGHEGHRLLRRLGSPSRTRALEVEGHGREHEAGEGRPRGKDDSEAADSPPSGERSSSGRTTARQARSSGNCSGSGTGTRRVKDINTEFLAQRQRA